MKILRYLPVLFVVLLSCQQTPERKFTKDDVEITCPKGWKITEEENLSDQGFVLSMEKEGLNASGLLTLTWITTKMDPDEYLTLFKEELANNIIYKNSDLSFDEPYNSTFNSIRCRAIKFTFALLSVKHEGFIYIFDGEEKTFAVLRQEAIEDKGKNEEDFKRIEKSLRMR